MYHINNDKSAAVSDDVYWIDANVIKPPLGVKLLVINKANGVALISPWSEHYWYTHWQALPRFLKDEK